MIFPLFVLLWAQEEAEAPVTVRGHLMRRCTGISALCLGGKKRGRPSFGAALKRLLLDDRRDRRGRIAPDEVDRGFHAAHSGLTALVCTSGAAAGDGQRAGPPSGLLVDPV